MCTVDPTHYYNYIYCIIVVVGERSQLKVFMSQGNINIIDSMGRTPLMYAVIGKQAKVCATYIHRYLYCIAIMMYMSIVPSSLYTCAHTHYALCCLPNVCLYTCKFKYVQVKQQLAVVYILGGKGSHAFVKLLITLMRV